MNLENHGEMFLEPSAPMDIPSSWCNQRVLDPVSDPVEDVANFLAEKQLKSGLLGP